MTTIEQTIREFLAERVLGEEEIQSLEPDTRLLGSGLINSLTLIHLVTFLETEFGFTVTPEEFRGENFASLRTIVAFVEERTSR